MKWIIEGRQVLRLSGLTAPDRNMLEQSLRDTADQQQALKDLVKAQGWDTQGGPQVVDTGDLTEFPALVTGLRYDEDNRPVWLWAYQYSLSGVTDWRKALLTAGTVTLTRVV